MRIGNNFETKNEFIRLIITKLEWSRFIVNQDNLEVTKYLYINFITFQRKTLDLIIDKQNNYLKTVMFE